MKIKTKTDTNIEHIMKMLRVLINGQTKLKEDMNTRFNELDTKFSKKIDDLDIKLTKRIDKIGYDLAELSDDTPTNEEFSDLEVRVTKVEAKVLLQ